MILRVGGAPPGFEQGLTPLKFRLDLLAPPLDGLDVLEVDHRQLWQGLLEETGTGLPVLVGCPFRTEEGMSPVGVWGR